MRLRITALVAGVIATVIAIGSTPALATQTQICGLSGAGYCINDWNNGSSGNIVKMYNGGSSNENFFVSRLYGTCNSSGTVTSTCPFVVGSGWNTYFQGQKIFEVHYDGSSLAVGTSTSLSTYGEGELTRFGGTGTMLVCNFGSGEAVSRYWTDSNYSRFGDTPSNSAPAGWLSGGNPGTALVTDSQGSLTQWGGPGWANLC